MQLLSVLFLDTHRRITPASAAAGSEEAAPGAPVRHGDRLNAALLRDLGLHRAASGRLPDAWTGY